MAGDLQATMNYFHDRTLGYWISKAEMERLALGFEPTSGYSRQPRILDKVELRALADYGRAVKELFLAWKVISTAFHQEIKRRNDDAALQGRLDRLDALLRQAKALNVPDRAAAIQRVFIAMLRSERGYFGNVVDDVDDAVIGQYAADFQEEATMFRAEFDRLLRTSGQPLYSSSQND
jgi:hypothetical protein